MKTKRIVFAALIFLLVSLLGFSVGAFAMQRLTVTEWDFVGEGIYSASPPLSVPNLQQLTATSQDDAQALDAIVDYYASNEETLAARFSEINPDRLKALYAMYISHVSHVYAPAEPYATLLEYIRQPYADCGSVARHQVQIARALGLRARVMEISGGTHAFVEVEIGGAWELFDGTTNVWINQSATRLMDGIERQYRAFYTPLLDASAPHNQYTLSAVRLRTQMTGLGKFWTPLATIIETG